MNGETGDKYLDKYKRPVRLGLARSAVASVVFWYSVFLGYVYGNVLKTKYYAMTLPSHEAAEEKRRQKELQSVRDAKDAEIARLQARLNELDPPRKTDSYRPSLSDLETNPDSWVSTWVDYALDKNFDMDAILHADE